MDIYSTVTLNRVIEELNEPSSFLLNNFFPNIQFSDSEEIWFDKLDGAPRITPFCSPLVAGRVVEDQGYSTHSFKPAYAKDKRRLLPNQPLRRRAGERIGGSVSPMERRQQALATQLVDQLEMLTRRETVMASEVLRTGKITVSGEYFPEVEVDFGRHADLTIDKPTADATTEWGDSGISPLADLEKWVDLTATKSGAPATTLVMDPKAWALFRANEDVKALLDTTERGGTSSLQRGPQAHGAPGNQARYKGTVGDLEIWVYQEPYVDEDGVTQQMLPDYTVIGVSPEMLGTRAYGLIQDEKSGYSAPRYFSKAWIEEDPPVRWLLLQSAPLIVPYRPDASFCATVKA